MILSKEQYYKRRWFLAILFLIVGFLLLYLSYGIFSYNVSKDELIVKNESPQLIKLALTQANNSNSLILTVEDKENKISGIINDTIITTFSKVFNIDNLNRYNLGNGLVFTDKELLGKEYRYSYWRDRLYELEINNVKILEYHKKEPTLGYIVLIIALFWITFQVWIIYRLVTKGIKNYDQFSK